MKRYLFRRSLGAVMVLFIAATLCYIIINVMPGDAVTFQFGASGTTDYAQQLRAQMGLDKPMLERYWVWLQNTMSGDFGYSYIFQIPVIDVIKQTLPYTLALTGVSFVFAIFISLIIGVFTAVRRNSKVDYILSTASLIGVSIPEIWIGSMIVVLFSRKLELLPFIGQAKFPDQLNFVDYIKMSLIPCIILTMNYIGISVRYVKTAVQEVLQEEYIRAARSRGLGRIRILFKHVLKNAAKPIITHITNILPIIINSAFIIESIFHCPGIGEIMIYANRSRDYPVLMGILLFIIASVVIISYIADILYLAVDPRIQYS